MLASRTFNVWRWRFPAFAVISNALFMRYLRFKHHRCYFRILHVCAHSDPVFTKLNSYYTNLLKQIRLKLYLCRSTDVPIKTAQR